MTYIERLQKVIKDLHGCDSQHLESVSVEERFQGKVIWVGLVEVFAVAHPKATRVYAWTAKNGGKEHFTAVLGIPPVDSPRKAVQASIVAAEKGKSGGSV